MNVVYIHYHLKHGGVSRVIQQQISICESLHWNYCILAADNCIELNNVIIIPQLNYDSILHKTSNDQTLSNAIDMRFKKQVQSLIQLIEESISTFFQDSNVDVIHVHNATLAKNKALIPALNALQHKYTILLQLHDFAEDGRPEVYSEFPYPEKAYYACINSRDKLFLLKSGLCEERLHYVPNLVSPLPGATSPPLHALSYSLPHSSYRPQAHIHSNSEFPKEVSVVSQHGSDSKRFALYPVRGIRRKNLGEVILLALLFEDICFGVTLPPNNERDMPSYRFWNQSGKDLHARVEFNCAGKDGFENILKRSDFFITTSIQEGFGFSFLEPWTVQKPVTGRTVPYVMNDFIESGMKMDSFYSEIPIPIKIVNIGQFRKYWIHDAQKRISMFSHVLSKQGLHDSVQITKNLVDNIEEYFDNLYASKQYIDFARLDTLTQFQVLQAIRSSEELAQEIRQSVPQFSQFPFSQKLANSCTNENIFHNYVQVYKVYGNEQYAQRLQGLYRNIIAMDSKEGNGKSCCINKQSLLQLYLDPAQFFPITSYEG